MSARARARAIGRSPPLCVWDARYAALHPPPPQGAAHADDAEQTFDDFVAMGARPPNEDGTGRFTPDGARNVIGILPLLLDDDGTVDGALLGDMQRLLAAHAGLRAEVLPSLGLRWDGAWAILDEAQGVEFPLADLRALVDGEGRRPRGKRRRAGSDDAPADVFAVLKVVEEYAALPFFAVVAVGAVPLAEEVDDGEKAALVIGRACGARAAVVSTRGVPRREVLCTALHEFYHTAGFDHSVFWRCLMNSQWFVGDAQEVVLAFAPHNLRKLMVMAKVPEEEEGMWVLERYLKLAKVARLLGPEFHGDAKWFDEKAWAVRVVSSPGN